MAKQFQAPTVHFFLNIVDMIRLLGVILILPASAMSISFLMEGDTPPIVGIGLFFCGFFLLGYRAHIVFDTINKWAIIERRTWGMAFSSHKFSTSDIEAFSAHKVVKKTVRWEKNHYTDQYEAHETGQTYTETSYCCYLFFP